MGIYKTAEEIQHILADGYRHYSRQNEHRLFTALLEGKGDPDFLLFGNAPRNLSTGKVDKFPLASDPLRSLKNGMISLVAVICRYAADLGADDESCYALSDYSINRIEEGLDKGNWRDMMGEICSHYGALIREGRETRYTRPVKRALRFIREHAREDIGLKDCAASAKVHPAYLSTLFRKETGSTLTGYIHRQKTEEACGLLMSGETAAETSRILMFRSPAYFSRVFKACTGMTPREWLAVSPGSKTANVVQKSPGGSP
jgi:AraC-like DNA-binding protein